MKKLLNKKGFTIVELVIVIAVIAVLAAVLIPTFSSLIEKANRSADIQAVRQMNSALSIESVGEKFEKVGEVIDSLEKSGISANNYKALAKDYRIVWDRENNKILYVNSNNVVEFPEDCKDIKYEYGKWITLDGKMQGDESWKESEEIISSYTVNGVELSFPENYYKYKVSTGPQLIDLEQTLNSKNLNSKYGENGANMIIELEENVEYDMLGAEWTPINEFAGVFNGNGATIKNISMKDKNLESKINFKSWTNSAYKPFGFITMFRGQYFGNVNLNVDYDNPSKVDTNNYTLAGAIGVACAESNTKVYIDNVVVSGTITGDKRVAGIVGFVGGNNTDKMKGTVIIQNCVNNATVTSTSCVNTYSTAAGIVSTSNFIDNNGKLEITKCINNGEISGHVCAGILANSFIGKYNQSESGYNPYNGYYYIYDNVNNGNITTKYIAVEGITNSEPKHYVSGIYNNFHTPNYNIKKNIYVFGNINNGKFISNDENYSVDQIISNNNNDDDYKNVYTNVPEGFASYDGTNIKIENSTITWQGEYSEKTGVNLSLYE